MDRNRAIEVLDYMESECVKRGARKDVEREAIQVAKAALKAQGEPALWLVRWQDSRIEEDFEQITYTEAEAIERAEDAAQHSFQPPTITPLYTAPQPESQPAQAVPDGELWSFVRSVMCQGADINGDHYAGKFDCYEEYSAHLDAAAAERAEQLRAMLAAAPAPTGGE